MHAVFFQKVLDISRREVLTTFLKQTIYGTVLIARNLLLELPFHTIRGLWSKYLVCPKLSIFELQNAETWFKTVIGEIFALIEPRVAVDGGIARPGGLAYFPSQSRSDIMESARLNRLLRFMYDGLERVIEPYALVFKRRKDGVAREYLYGWDLHGGRERGRSVSSRTSQTRCILFRFSTRHSNRASRSN